MTRLCGRDVTPQPIPSDQTGRSWTSDRSMPGPGRSVPASCALTPKLAYWMQGSYSLRPIDPSHWRPHLRPLAPGVRNNGRSSETPAIYIHSVSNSTTSLCFGKHRSVFCKALSVPYIVRTLAPRLQRVVVITTPASGLRPSAVGRPHDVHVHFASSESEAIYVYLACGGVLEVEKGHCAFVVALHIQAASLVTRGCVNAAPARLPQMLSQKIYI